MERYEHELTKLGLSFEDIQALRRIARTLRRWAERECGTETGCIEWDEATNKPYWRVSMTRDRFPIRDQETPALKRLAKIMASYSDLAYYHQGDPRGASLWIIPKDRLLGRDVETCYVEGIAIY